MLNDSDYNALMSSEIFRDFYAQETQKEAKKEANKETVLQRVERTIDEKYDALKAFADFEKKIKSNPVLINKFKQIKNVLASNPEITKKTDQKFVQAVMMLNLGDE